MPQVPDGRLLELTLAPIRRLACDGGLQVRIEHLIGELSERYTIILAPHNEQQAARVADYAAFFLQGELVEFAPGKKLFINPKDKRTEDYVQGRFG